MFGTLAAPAEIELAVDDLEILGIHTGSLAGRRQTPRSVPAVLGRVAFRIRNEHIPIAGIGEIPFGIVPLVGKFFIAFYCAALGVVSDGVITLDGHTEKGLVYLIDRQRDGAIHHQQRDNEEDCDGPLAFI